MKRKIILLLAVSLSTFLFAQEDWKVLSEENYSINYPENWTYSNKKPQPSIKFMLLADESSQEKDAFRENVNLTTESLGGNNIDSKDYTDFAIKQVKAQMPSAKIISNKSIKIDGRDAQEVIWSGDFGNGMLLKFKQVLLAYNDTGYVLTFSSTEAEFDNYIIDGDKILNSFKLAK
ncbi:MAG: hypothetical protein Wins2KO_14140 [Winogradskyella sp.]